MILPFITSTLYTVTIGGFAIGWFLRKQKPKSEYAHIDHSVEIGRASCRERVLRLV